MDKKIIFCLVVIALISASTNAQGFFGFGSSTFGFGFGQDFHNIALQSAAAKLSAQNLPEDLQLRVADTLAKANVAFAACENLIFWQYRRCTALELKNAMAGLKAIENEAELRNTTSTTATVPAADASK